MVNTHLHITSWVLAVILFLIVIMFMNKGKAKPAKIVQMVLRLDYLLILYSGGSLLANYFNGEMLIEAIIKGLAGLWVIAMMEMIVIRRKKGKPVLGFWVQFGIAVLITIALGFGRLPLGILP